MRGDISGYASNSEARAALIGIVRGFAHDDVDQIERILRRSNLDQSRWDEPRRNGHGTQPFISQMEAGLKNPTYLTLQKLALALGCEAADLVTDPEDADRPAA
jgi:hypothetical protein